MRRSHGSLRLRSSLQHRPRSHHPRNSAPGGRLRALVQKSVVLSPEYERGFAQYEELSNRESPLRVQRVLKSGVKFAIGSDMWFDYPGRLAVRQRRSCSRRCATWECLRWISSAPLPRMRPSYCRGLQNCARRFQEEIVRSSCDSSTLANAESS